MLTSKRKLAATLFGVVVLAVIVTGIAADRSLRADQLAAVETSLSERARMVVDQIGAIDFVPARRDALDALADRTSTAGGMRVTLIAKDGEVLGDSEITGDRLAQIENHGDRPEGVVALSGKLGTATRRSETIGHELLYLALPARHGGVVRVAVALSELEEARAALRQRLVLAGGAGLLIAVLLSFLVTRTALAPIREVRRAAEAIARGELDERPPLSAGDELGEISNAIHEIASQLRARLEDATDEKEQLRAVLESMVEGVLVVDAESVILLANPRFRAFYDVRSEIMGDRLADAIRDPDLNTLLAEVANSGDMIRTVLTTGEHARTLRVQAARFPRDAASLSGSVFVFHDISELERLEEIRRDFVANASHELRTPLTAIQGFTETLLEAELPEDKRRAYLEVIDRHARRLGTIVRDLLAISTVETGKWHVEPAMIDVQQIAQDVMNDLERRATEAELAFRIHTEGSPEAFADPGSVEQILTNLLENAVKYSEPGGEIDIEIHAHDQRLQIAITDKGIGIPAEDVARIFERFYRVDKARSRGAGGTGLGLSIVRHLVQKSGGEISVESTLGEGSRFSFSLPNSAESA